MDGSNVGRNLMDVDTLFTLQWTYLHVSTTGKQTKLQNQSLDYYAEANHPMKKMECFTSSSPKVEELRLEKLSRVLMISFLWNEVGMRMMS